MKTLILKYLTNSITKAELKKLCEWLKHSKNKSVFKTYFRDAYTVNMSFDNVDVDKAFEKVWQDIKAPEKPVKRLIPNWTKYAAAAIIILGLGFFFKDNLFNNKVNNTPIIVNHNIKIGTDKATLTLENGTEIALEKGQNYQTKNQNSNGEKLVYNSDDNSKSEIAYNYLTVPRGGQFFLQLADGTKVWLNSESKLKYPVNFIAGQTREVELVYGEVYFEVSPSTAHHGDKFKVLTEIQDVEVIGTKFNVKAYKDESLIYTTLVEGSVAVSTVNAKELLKPNQQAVLNIKNKNISINDIDVLGEISWVKGEFIFNKKSLKDIMKVLSRWYDVDVIFTNKDLEDTKFIGQLGKNQNVEDILILIKNTEIINAYEIKNNTILLK